MIWVFFKTIKIILGSCDEILNKNYPSSLPLIQNNSVEDYEEKQFKNSKNTSFNEFEQSIFFIVLIIFLAHPNHRKLTLNVGGFANLYEGTSIKVKCPVRNFNRQQIYWTKNGKKIKNNGNYFLL